MQNNLAYSDSTSLQRKFVTSVVFLAYFAQTLVMKNDIDTLGGFHKTFYFKLAIIFDVGMP
jgi:hypothetical protein